MEEIIKKVNKKPYWKREGPRKCWNTSGKGIAGTDKDKRISNWKRDITYDFTFLTEEEVKYYINYFKQYAHREFGFYNMEIISDTLLKVFRYADKYDIRLSTKKTWITAIYKNEIRQYIKINKRNRTISIDEIYNNDPDNKPLKDRIEAIIDTPEDDRLSNIKNILYILNNSPELELLKTLVDSKCTYKELSDLLDIPIGTIKNRIYLQRKLLKQKIKYI